MPDSENVAVNFMCVLTHLQQIMSTEISYIYNEATMDWKIKLQFNDRSFFFSILNPISIRNHTVSSSIWI